MTYTILHHPSHDQFKEENEIEKQKVPRSKSSQQETSRGSSKLAGLSKRSGTKGEGNTTSALSKLSMRLNFLKERRSQIASELSNMDKGKSTGQPSPSSVQNQNLQETERETISNQSQSQRKESQSSKLQSQHVLDRGRSENGGERGRGGNQPSTTPRTFSR